MKKLTLAFGLLAGLTAFAQTEIKTSVFGDLRFRNESIEAEGVTGKDNYDHLRLRARLGVKAQINETLSTEIRLATGTGGTATNQTFGNPANNNGSRNYDFKLDRAFFKYSADNKLVFKAGRTDNPFVSVGDNNMIFDGDLNFDGASISYTHKLESMSFQLVLGHTILIEGQTAAPKTDVSMQSAELAWRMNMGEAHSLLVTVADHSANLKGQTALAMGALGNSVSGGAYIYNYDVTTVGLEYGLKTSVPLTFFAEMANNGRTSENDTATIYGVRVNKLKKKGDWMLSVDSREVEKDSIVGALADSDSYGGGTNGTSLNTSIGYGLDDNANLMVSYLTGKTLIASGETEVDRNRVQVDINVKF